MTMDDECNAFIKNQTWDLDREESYGYFEMHKAQLVGDGVGRQVHVNCGETFNSVFKSVAIRIVISHALSKAWQIHQLDVKNAFLSGELKETVYMYQSLRFKDPTHYGHVCLLRKSIYGLKQAPRAWYKWFSRYVSSIGFIQSMATLSSYTRNTITRLTSSYMQTTSFSQPLLIIFANPSFHPSTLNLL